MFQGHAVVLQLSFCNAVECSIEVFGNSPLDAPRLPCSLSTRRLSCEAADMTAIRKYLSEQFGLNQSKNAQGSQISDKLTPGYGRRQFKLIESRHGYLSF